MICKECGFECNSIKALRIHLTKKHKLNDKQYYIKHIAHEKLCIECAKPAKFLGIALGFDDRCTKCRVRFLQRQHYENMTAEEKLAIANKNKATKLKKYGNKNYNNLLKGKKTKLERYGDENYNNRCKAKQSYPCHTSNIIAKQKQTHFNNWFNRFNNKICNFFNISNISTIDGYRINMQCNACHHEFSFVKGALNNFMRWHINKICPLCFPTCKTSRAEREIYDFIASLDKNVYANDHTILGKKELDIYIPDKKLGIEYDGLYWHSVERGKHIKEKTDLCKTHGIRCIHIFEDEWLNKSQIVKSRICSALGHNKRIYAKKLQFKEIDIDAANDFLEKNHLLGKSACSFAVGLHFNNSLVAVMTFAKNNSDENSMTMTRFASALNTNVVGAAGKLIKHTLSRYKEIHEIIAFADCRWDTGDMFIKLGFEKIGENSPNKFLVLNDCTRVPITRSNKNVNAKYTTIYDCGTIVFRYVRK